MTLDATKSANGGDLLALDGVRRERVGPTCGALKEVRSADQTTALSREGLEVVRPVQGLQKSATAGRGAPGRASQCSRGQDTG